MADLQKARRDGKEDANSKTKSDESVAPNYAANVIDDWFRGIEVG
jgi:hypothetical protein